MSSAVLLQHIVILIFNFRHLISLRMEDSTVGGPYVLIYDHSGP